MSGGAERLHLQYLPSFNPGHFSDAEYAHLGNESFALEIAEAPAVLPDGEMIATHYRARLRGQRAREFDAGSTLYGPHRDDFRFLVNGRDLRLYGSRGQQRSGALATKLAEVQVMRDRTGSAPLLLLDDVMSELDANRRATLLRALEGVPQAIVTTTDWEDFAPDLRNAARRLHVDGGAVREAEVAVPEVVVAASSHRRGAAMSHHRILRRRAYESEVSTLPEGVRRKAEWATLQLGARGRTPSTKSTVGLNMRWRRSPVQGSHYYLWWIPASDSGH